MPTFTQRELDFIDIIKSVVQHPNFQSMLSYVHHGEISTAFHSVLVAYLAYLYVLKHRSKVEIKSLIRGALLHDYYLYDWHQLHEGHHLHGFRHPKFSYQNALKDFPDINSKEKNIIMRHMWPLTVIPPKYKESWIVQYCDKKATWMDYKHKNSEKYQKIQKSIKKFFDYLKVAE